MKTLYRTVLLIAATIIIVDKARSSAMLFMQRFFAKYKSSVEAEFELWWMSGPSEIVKGQLEGLPPEIAQERLATLRDFALTLAARATSMTENLVGLMSRPSAAGRIVTSLFESSEVNFNIMRSSLLDFGVDPKQLEAHFSPIK